jgi:hypothetical protein
MQPVGWDDRRSGTVLNTPPPLRKQELAEATGMPSACQPGGMRTPMCSTIARARTMPFAKPWGTIPRQT